MAGLKVDWQHTPMYNTVMSVAVGVGLLLLVDFGRSLARRTPMVLEGWALAFGTLGVILTFLGGAMTVTWPLSNIAPFDNIIFGEPSLAFGVMLLAATVFLWRKGWADTKPEPSQLVSYFVEVARPISWFGAAMGLACFAIAAAGEYFVLFAAPPEEPLSGAFANYPLLEATFISILYILVGVGAVLFPLFLLRLRPALGWIMGVCWTLAGLAFLIFGALNFFTHIGLIIHTS